MSIVVEEKDTYFHNVFIYKYINIHAEEHIFRHRSYDLCLEGFLLFSIILEGKRRGESSYCFL